MTSSSETRDISTIADESPPPEETTCPKHCQEHGQRSLGTECENTLDTDAQKQPSRVHSQLKASSPQGEQKRSPAEVFEMRWQESDSRGLRSWSGHTDLCFPCVQHPWQSLDSVFPQSTALADRERAAHSCALHSKTFTTGGDWDPGLVAIGSSARERDAGGAGRAH
jgi:hypothetical protein